MKFAIRRGLILLFSLSVSFLPMNPASADEQKDPDLNGFQFHGFLSQGAIKTTDNNYLVNSQLGSFDFTEAGLNFTKQLSDNLRTGMQLFVQRLGDTQDLTPRLDWAYLDYRWKDWLGFRFGRVQQHVGLYNDIVDIDAARAPILLPQSVYPEQLRNYFLAQDGFEFYGYSGSGPAGALDYRLYLGTIPVTIAGTPGIQSFNTPFLVGSRLLWDTPVDGFRIAQSLQTMRFDATYQLGAQLLSVEIPVSIWLSSLEYTHKDLVLAAEYSRWFVSSGDLTAITQGAYVMGTYRINSWLEPALYYSLSLPNINSYSGQQNHQNDFSATLRFDVNPFWMVKVEGHYMLGTAGLSSALNNGIPLTALSDSWAAFLLKTTAYF